MIDMRVSTFSMSSLEEVSRDITRSSVTLKGCSVMIPSFFCLDTVVWRVVNVGVSPDGDFVALTYYPPVEVDIRAFHAKLIALASQRGKLPGEYLVFTFGYLFPRINRLQLHMPDPTRHASLVVEIDLKNPTGFVAPRRRP